MGLGVSIPSIMSANQLRGSRSVDTPHSTGVCCWTWKLTQKHICVKMCDMVELVKRGQSLLSSGASVFWLEEDKLTRAT